LIARLAGVHRVWEVEPGIFAVVHTGDCAQLVRDLKSLAVEQGAHLQSCELAQ
jgi:hypothetical protein